MKLSHHRHHRYSIGSFLVLLLVSCCVIGLASGKNLLSQLGDIMTDGGGGGGGDKIKKTVDYDAATGTVQDIAAKKDSTCDGQLASALVKSNDLATTTQKERDNALTNHKAALETIAALEQHLAQMGSDLVEERDAVSTLKGERANAVLAEKDRALKELEALRGEKDGIIASSKEESTRALESVKDNSQKDLQALKEEKDEMISSLEAKLTMSNEELEATMRLELEKAKNDKETTLAAITADRDTTVAELTKTMLQAAEDAAEVLRTTKEEAELKLATAADVLRMTEEEAKPKLAAVEADRDTRLAELTQRMEQAAEDAAEVLRTTKDEAKAFMLEQVAVVKEQSAQAKTENDERLTEKNKKIKNLQEYTENMLEKKAAVERSLEEGNSEIAHWRSLHSHRSYCNMTHVASDMYDVSASAYNQVWEAATVVYAESLTLAGVGSKIASTHVSDGLKYSSRFINDQVDEQWPIIQPYYEEHIAGNYQTHLEPHLRQHVFPTLHQASVWFHNTAMPFVVQTIEDGKQVYDAQVSPVLKKHHQSVVRLYGEYCQSSLQEFRKASKELDILKDYPPPAYFMESWKKSCANPQESLNALMQGTFFLFAAIFHRCLFGLAWWIVTFLMSLVIRFTPLRFVFSRHSGTSASASTESSSSSSSSPPATPSKKGSSPPAMAKAE